MSLRFPPQKNVHPTESQRSAWLRGSCSCDANPQRRPAGGTYEYIERLPSQMLVHRLKIHLKVQASCWHSHTDIHWNPLSSNTLTLQNKAAETRVAQKPPLGFFLGSTSVSVGVPAPAGLDNMKPHGTFLLSSVWARIQNTHMHAPLPPGVWLAASSLLVQSESIKISVNIPLGQERFIIWFVNVPETDGPSAASCHLAVIFNWTMDFPDLFKLGPSAELFPLLKPSGDFWWSW